MKIGTLLAALAGGIVMFMFGFLFFGVLLADFFRENIMQYPGLMRETPVVWAIFLFNVVWAWLIAWIVERSYGSDLTAPAWARGAKVGAITMFVIGLGMDLDYFAFMNVFRSLTPVLVHLLVITILGALAGAVIGIVLGYFNRAKIPGD